MSTKCFACNKPNVTLGCRIATTRDGQTVFVGRDCAKKIKAAGEAGYQPPTGGPLLWLAATAPRQPEEA